MRTAAAPSIVEFLNARIAEDEQAALAATPGPWESEGDDPTDDEVYTVHDGEHGDLVGDVVAYARGRDRQQPNTVHIARQDPTRTRRAVETKRRIMALHVLDEEGVHDADGIERPGRECYTCFAEDWPCLTLRLLTLEFQDHEDYRTEWSEVPEP